MFTNWCESPESQSRERKASKMQFQPNVVILTGRPASAASACPNGRTHIFTLNEGHLYVSQGPGRPVNRAFYEMVRGGIRLSMEGTKPRMLCVHTGAVACLF